MRSKFQSYNFIDNQIYFQRAAYSIIFDCLMFSCKKIKWKVKRASVKYVN